jgi:hypothetical protein
MTRFQLAVTAALLSLIASNAWADLRTYDVPPQYQQEIYNALARVLNPQGQPTQGRVQLLPSGQILVNASPETLEQVEAVLQTIRARPAEATPRAALRYWAVLGSRVAVASPPGSAPPNVLGDVLAELRRMHGDLTFRVLGTAALVTESGEEGHIDGMPLDVEQQAFVQGNRLNAELHLRLTGLGTPDDDIALLDVGSLSVHTSLLRGEFLVLGEGELHERQDAGFDGLVFYIVHWPEE